MPQAKKSQASSSVNEDSPVAFYDEANHKVLIISNNNIDGTQVQHCIKWSEDTNTEVIGKAIEDVLNKVKRTPPKKNSA